jgi:hypothetical protein
MKKLSKTLFLVFVAVSLVNCDKIKDAADIKIETKFTHDFSVDATTATESDGSAIFSETASIDLNEGDVKDYVDKLKNIEFKQVFVEVIAFSGPTDATISGDVAVDTYKLIIPESNMLVLFNNVQKLDLSEQAGTFNHMKDQLLSKKMISYTINGRISEVPANAQMRITYVVDITANPL